MCLPTIKQFAILTKLPAIWNGPKYYTLPAITSSPEYLSYFFLLSQYKCIYKEGLLEKLIC